MGDAFGTIIRTEGLTGVYKGVQSPLAGLFAMNATLFAAYDSSKRLLGDSPQTPLTNGQIWVAGGIAGTAVAFVEGPVDFFKCQLQVRGDQYKGFVNCVSTIVRERGVLAAYQGIGPTLIRNCIGNAFWYGMYDLVREMQLHEGQAKSSLATYQVMIAGSAAGIGYWVSTYPVDVIKSTVQGDHPDVSKRRYKGMMDAGRQIVAEHGVKGLFRGFTPCLTRAVPANAATFVAYEFARKKLDTLF